jgi:hypothetical protein
MFARFAAIPALVSNAPGKEYASESLARFSSSAGITAAAIPCSSLIISAAAAPVTSVRTPLATWNGPGALRNTNCDDAP